MTEDTQALTQRIAKALNEPNVELIEKIIEAVGPQKTVTIFLKSANLYKAGFTIQDGTRKRTPGGCFFYAAKSALRRRHRFRVGLYFRTEQKALQALQDEGYSREDAMQHMADQMADMTKAEHKRWIKQLAGEEVDEPAEASPAAE